MPVLRVRRSERSERLAKGGGEEVRLHIVSHHPETSITASLYYQFRLALVPSRTLQSTTIPHIMWERMREQTTAPRRHPRLALSAREVQAAKSTGRVRRIADGGGLYLVVAPNGSKSWVLRVVVKGKRCDLGLGSASVTTLAEAREEPRPTGVQDTTRRARRICGDTRRSPIVWRGGYGSAAAAQRRIARIAPEVICCGVAMCSFH